MKSLLFFIILMCTPVMAYSSPTSSEIQVKAAVLGSMIQAATPTDDSSYGLDLPEKELRQLEKCFDGKIKLFTVKEYDQRYGKSGRDLVSTCFWIKVVGLTTTQAVVEGGLYPVEVKTKYGLMPANTTDFAYHLAKQDDRWTITSKAVIGES